MEEEKEVRDLGRIRSGEIGAIVEKYIPKRKIVLIRPTQ